MKVMLISSNIAVTPYHIYPLGLSMVSGALRKAGHEVSIFDFLESGKSFDKLEGSVRVAHPEVIGISMRNIDNVNLMNEQRYIEAVREMVAVIRRISKAVIVLGGSAFSIMPEEILREVGADYGIVGEGETQMLSFLEGLKNGDLPEDRCISSSKMIDGKNIPSANYDSGLMEFYLKSGNMASVQSKRGCVHSCVYCSYPFLEGHRIRPRDPARVVDDIEKLVNEYKAKYIFFTDSVFNDKSGTYINVVREMDRRGVCVPWTAFFKPGEIDEETVLMMKKTGLKAAEIGSDASTDTTLEGLKKDFNYADILECNDLFTRNGVATANYYMFGCPGETVETVLEGIENIKRVEKTVSFIFMGIRILPGTPLFDIACRDGIIKPDSRLLEPVYYIAPGVDNTWLEKTLTAGFSNIRNCIFPPDKLDTSLMFLHKMGYSGSMWEMLIPGNEKRKRRRNYA